MKIKLLFFSLIIIWSSNSFGQCSNISLISDHSAQCQPALFKWYLTNVPKGSLVYWDFGKGIQQGQDTLYAYIQDAGKVNVDIKIQFPDNTICNINKSDFVEVVAKPIPDFYASRKILCDGPDTVTYFDNTPNSTKRSWIIDGVNHYNASKTQKHQYATTGIKKLTLVVENSIGCRAIKEFDSAAIIYKDVIVDFKADNRTGCVEKSVTFTQNINANGLKIASWKWKFPGGIPNEQNIETPISIEYATPGSFSPSLEVTAENGCIHSFTKKDFLTFGKIDSITLKISDSSICNGRTIIIENRNKTLPGIFKWTLPGTTSNIQPDQYTCKAKYETLGFYDISVVYDYNGCTVSKFLSKVIEVKGVKADFSSKDYYHCLLPHNVHLTNLSKSYEPGKMIYQWLYYNNAKLIRSSTNVNDSFKVTQTGQYDVMLITRHSNGCVDTFKQLNFIRNKEIMPAFDAAFKVGCIGQDIEFRQVTPPSSYKASDNFKWTFYDKNTSKVLGTSNAISPKFAYYDTGLYTIKMVADNGIGCKDSVTKKQFIEIVNPKIAFEITNPIICKNEVLLGKAKSQPTRANFTYFWYLKNKIDGSQIFIQDSILKTGISNAGEYNLKFAHEINKGCRDSIVNNNLVKVNGISAVMQLDTFNGCTPLTVKPKATITENFHFGNAGNLVKYKWSVSSAANVTILGDTSKTPVFSFNVMGEYTISLEVTNSAGCRYSVSSRPIYVGVHAGIQISDDVVCAGQDVVLTNQSWLFPTKIKWLLEPGTYTTDARDKNQITIHFKDDASHLVGLAVNKLDKCFDTVYRSVKSIVVKADLIALETNMKCAPVYAQFISHSKYADSLKWDFGDGNFVITTDTFVANIYRTNSGSQNGFDISLIAQSNEGCSDTLIKKDYIKVTGPVPSFTLSNNVGCEPLHVIFKNTSTDVFKHFMNYDDGSPLDSSFGKYTYSIISKGLNTQQYTPKMYAIDSLGCKAEFESPVKVIVKANSKAAFTVSDSVICQNQSVFYTDKSIKVTNSDFFLKGNGRISVKSDTIKFDKNGNFELIQIVTNGNSCVDSVKQKISVNANPVANFVTNDTVCLQKVLSFTNLSSSEVPVASYKWEILNTDKPVYYQAKDIKYSFQYFGDAIVKLTVTDELKCKSSISKTLNIPNPAETPAGTLKVVSINRENHVMIVSNPVSYFRFSSSKYYLDADTMQNILSSNSATGDQFDYYTNSTKDTSLCFDLRIIDHCGYESKMGLKHCTVFLKVGSTKPFTNQLNWSHYIGWQNIDNYHIYRKIEGESAFKLLATTSSKINSYLDSGLCNLPCSYYVEANYNQLKSQSNSVKNSPLYIFPAKYSLIKNVSVMANNSIEIKWPASTSPLLEKYTLFKTDVQTNNTKEIEIKNHSFIDNEVNTSNHNYIYQITETDKCGNTSLPGLEGKSIVLNTKSSNYKTMANWNTYKTWKSGVKEYQLQIEKNRGFTTVSSTTNIDSLAQHDQSLETIHGPYCYRIMAISTDLKDTSYSNISCIISPSTLFFPNAFSPNGDDINEKIGARSLFTYNNTSFSGRNFTLEIFDRWGEKLFETHDIDEEWDGFYKGKKVQEGVFMYRLKAMGLDNRSYSLEGTITVIL